MTSGSTSTTTPATIPRASPVPIPPKATSRWVEELSLKYSHSFTNLFGFADSKNSAYLDLSWNYEFTPGWTLNTHVGHQDVANTPGFSYADWKLGVTRAFSHGYSVALGYYDTNATRTAYTNAYGHFVGRATGVLTLSKTF